jgi:hypothetical protein
VDAEARRKRVDATVAERDVWLGANGDLSNELCVRRGPLGRGRMGLHCPEGTIT